VTDADWTARRTGPSHLFDAHRRRPGVRATGYLADEAREAGQADGGADRVAAVLEIASWWSAFGKKKRGKNGKKPGPPAHDDLVRRDFAADGPNLLWLTDITEHPTAEGPRGQ
jgi:putative transposase